MGKKTIILTLQVEGLHQWPNCNIDSVSYLSNLHRHMFHIKCELLVFHMDRDIEFIDLKHQILNCLSKDFFDYKYQCLLFDSMSCEHIAEYLFNMFGLESCEVFEDGENGARITR